MALSFLELLPELQNKVYSYCSEKDLLNVACCNSQFHQTVIHLLWYVFETEWKLFETKKGLKNKSKYFKYIAILRLTGKKTNFSSYDNRRRLAFSYRQIIKFADPLKLFSLHLDGFVPNSGFKLVSKKLVGLTELSLENIKIADWEYLWRLKNLKKLSFQNSHINDVCFQGIVTLQSLQELQLVQCSEITGRCLSYISQVRISKLVYAYQELFHSEDERIQDLSSLFDLKYLSLEFTGINDRLVTNIQCNLKNLIVLNVSWCSDLTDSCFINISQLIFLQNLNVSRCTRITDAGVLYLSDLKSLEWLDISGCSVITDKGLSYLAQVSSLKEIDLSFCTNISYESIIAYQKRYPIKKIILSQF